ncbi:MAG: hypothetical protein K0U36_05380 [Alphaproteobacteria bacterium]|nr:hypothetical protein [Alphaproteobacteria bacterium]
MTTNRIDRLRGIVIVLTGWTAEHIDAQPIERLLILVATMLEVHAWLAPAARMPLSPLSFSNAQSRETFPSPLWMSPQ